MCVLTEEEIAFIRDLARRPRTARMCVSIKRFNIKRLIDEKYVGIQWHEGSQADLEGWELVRKFRCVLLP
jgi:hypothetical protein